MGRNLLSCIIATSQNLFFLHNWRTPQALPEALLIAMYMCIDSYACEILKLVKLFAIQFSTKTLSRRYLFTFAQGVA